MIVLLVMIQVLYCTNTREYIQIFALVGGTRLRLVPPTRTNICIYPRKLYNKVNLTFGLFDFLVSRDCCVAFPTMQRVCLQFVIVVSPDHTRLLLYQ